MSVNSLDLLSKITHFDKYARYRDDLKRREVYPETVDRSYQMMRNHVMNLDSFKNQDPLVREGFLKDLEEAYNSVHRKEILPSMRNMQFAGKAIERNHARIYNCWYATIVDQKVFSEIVFLLLSGGGVGFSVRGRHVGQLPTIKKTNGLKVHYVEDTIEGWADAVDVLLGAYFNGLEYPIFDYSLIRPEGAPLKVTGGKAPGPAKFAESMGMVQALLDKVVEEGQERQLRPAEVHRIICMFAACIKAGGIRRSALISLFDYDDIEMIDIKSGEWWKTDLYLENANNSACFEDDPNLSLAEQEFEFKRRFRIFWERAKATKSGDPGFVRVGPDDGFNPCQPSHAPVIIKDKGLATFGELNIGDEIWSESGWTKVVNKWSNGFKDVYKYRTSAGEFIGTSNHRIVENGVKIEVGQASGFDRLVGPQDAKWNLDPQFIMDGLVFGDGCAKAECKNPVYLIIGDDDQDYFTSEISHLIKGLHVNGGSKEYNVSTNVSVETMSCRVWDRNIPEYIWQSSDSDRASFLRGLFSANGSVVGNGGRVTLKGTNKDMIYDVQTILNSLGIRSYITTNKSKENEFENGTYICRESYDLNITTDRVLFRDKIGFIQKYKQDKISDYVDSVYSHPRSKTTFEIKETIYLGKEEVFDITVDNETHTYWTSGTNVSNCAEVNLWSFQACNLVEINGRLILSQSEYNRLARQAALIATVQASFTDFIYLSDRWKKQTEKEALIGVGITGISDGLMLELDSDEAANEVKAENARVAAILGINAAARTTVVKPSGSTSCVLATSSGIHKMHYRYFIRHARILKNSALYKFLKEKSPNLVVDNVFTPDTDAYIAYPVAVPEDVPVAGDFTAIQFLEEVKQVQNSWIKSGYNYGELHNNVSCTVTIGEDEWDEVCEWMCDNWTLIKAISWTPKFEQDEETRKVYPQPPFMFIDKEEYERRASLLQDIDLAELIEEEDATSLQGEAACAGGACEIV